VSNKARRSRRTFGRSSEESVEPEESREIRALDPAKSRPDREEWLWIVPPTGGRNELNAMCGNSIEASRRTADNLSVKDPKSGHFTESQKVNSLFPSLFL
jgi:hypothetical protein